VCTDYLPSSSLYISKQHRNTNSTLFNTFVKLEMIVDLSVVHFGRRICFCVYIVFMCDRGGQCCVYVCGAGGGGGGGVGRHARICLTLLDDNNGC
jgi:hypothetical protein